MIINRKSWHYKLWKKFGGRELDVSLSNVSLCGYCQRLFWMGIFSSFIGLTAIFIFGAILYNIAIGFYYDTGEAFAITGIIVVCFCILDYYIEYRPKRKNKEPGILGAWLQAKKEKVCPLIDFKD